MPLLILISNKVRLITVLNVFNDFTDAQFDTGRAAAYVKVF